MKTRSPLAVLAATGVAGLGLTALATPASANTTVTVEGTWSNDNNERFIGGSISATSVTGESFSFQNSALGLPAGEVNVEGAVLLDTTDCAQTSCNVENGETVTLTVKSGAANSPIRLQVVGVGTFMEINDTDELFTVTFGSTPEPDGSITNGLGLPTPHIQQFGKPDTGTCDEAQPEGLNWGGAASGGWGQSWAQWANEGQGGPVCTRTLAYNTSTGTWQVR